MTPTPIIAVFAGGISSERDVSLGSGRSSAVALARSGQGADLLMVDYDLDIDGLIAANGGRMFGAKA